MNRHAIWLKRSATLSVWLAAMLGTGAGSLAAPAGEPGRLFYTPAQRAQLEAARARNVTQVRPADSSAGPAPLRFDGVVIRSDGSGTRWVNGRPQAGTAGVADLKPGQVRADGKVYEPYQVLRPGPAQEITREAAP